MKAVNIPDPKFPLTLTPSSRGVVVIGLLTSFLVLYFITHYGRVPGDVQSEIVVALKTSPKVEVYAFFKPYPFLFNCADEDPSWHDSRVVLNRTQIDQLVSIVQTTTSYRIPIGADKSSLPNVMLRIHRDKIQSFPRMDIFISTKSTSMEISKKGVYWIPTEWRDALIRMSRL